MPTFFVKTAHVEGSPWHAATSSVRILLRLFGSLKKIFRSNKLLFRPLTLNPTRSRPKIGSSFYLATYCGTNSAAIFQFCVDRTRFSMSRRNIQFNERNLILLDQNIDLTGPDPKRQFVLFSILLYMYSSKLKSSLFSKKNVFFILRPTQ